MEYRVGEVTIMPVPFASGYICVPFSRMRVYEMSPIDDLCSEAWLLPVLSVKVASPATISCTPIPTSTYDH